MAGEVKRGLERADTNDEGEMGDIFLNAIATSCSGSERMTGEGEETICDRFTVCCIGSLGDSNIWFGGGGRSGDAIVG